jgi:hypothetical protein
MFTVGSLSTYIIVLVSNALKHVASVEACRNYRYLSRKANYIEYHFPGDVSNDHLSKKRHRLK